MILQQQYTAYFHFWKWQVWFIPLADERGVCK